MKTRQGKHPESGFAMLLIFAMASILAISLYYTLPRVAFESQRDKEQTLIDRGEQYERAIQLYVRKNRRWPAKVEDLENTNGVRYLRRRYVDPMTGKDEWRPIHVGPNGVLTDSLVKTQKKDGKTASVDNFIAEVAPLNGGADPQGAVNPGLRRRPSDGAPQGPSEGNNVAQFQVDGSQPGQLQPGQLQPGQLQPGQQQPGQQTPGQGVWPPPGANVPPGFSPSAPNGLPPQLQRQGTQAGPPVNNQTGGISVFGGIGSSVPVQVQGPQGVAGTGNPNTGFAQPGGGNVPQPGNGNAAQLIQNLLTAPRPGGQPGGTGGAQAGQIQGGGIAGFASKFEGEGIKTYREQTEYQKWEFVYDMSKDPAITGRNGASLAGPNGTNGQPGLNGQNAPPLLGQVPSATGAPATAK